MSSADELCAYSRVDEIEGNNGNVNDCTRADFSRSLCFRRIVFCGHNACAPFNARSTFLALLLWLFLFCTLVLLVCLIGLWLIFSLVGLAALCAGSSLAFFDFVLDTHLRLDQLGVVMVGQQ